MECNDIQKRLSAYIEGLVSADEKISIDKHLRVCDKCQKYLADLKSTIKLVSNLEEIEPPPWLTQRIMARIKSDLESRRGILQKLLYPLYVKIPLAGIATIAIALTTIYIFKTIHPDVRIAKAPTETSQKLPVQEISEPQKKIIGREMKISKEKQKIPKEQEIMVRHKRPPKIMERARQQNEIMPSERALAKEELKQEGAPLKLNLRAAGRSESAILTVSVLNIEKAEDEIKREILSLGGIVIKIESFEDKKILITKLESKKVQELMDKLKSVGEVKQYGEISMESNLEVKIRIEIVKKSG